MSGNDENVRPRYCVIGKRDDFNGFGFNLHAEKGRAGQFIGKVDDDSPAQHADLRQGDRIVEVDGINIGNENHQQVVGRIKSSGHTTRLLVVDSETDKYYKDNMIRIHSLLPEVQTNHSDKTQKEDEDKTPQTQDANLEIHAEVNGHVNHVDYDDQNGHTVQDQVDEDDDTKPVENEFINTIPEPAIEPDPSDDDHEYINANVEIENHIEATEAVEFQSAVRDDDDAQDDKSDSHHGEDEAEVQVVEVVEPVVVSDEPEPAVLSEPEPVVVAEPEPESPIDNGESQAIEVSELTDDEVHDQIAGSDSQAACTVTVDAETGVAECDKTSQSEVVNTVVTTTNTNEPEQVAQPITEPVSNGTATDPEFIKLSAKEMRERIANRKKADVRSQKLDFKSKLSAFESMK